MVDLGLELDADKLSNEVKKLRADLEQANANYEREVADAKRIRAESSGLRDRIEELRDTVKDREEQIAAHGRAADELREELHETRDELSRVRTEMGELAENMSARERQLARSGEDVSKLKDDIDDLNRQLMELARTKDEGWKKLNDQLTEIEHLREVINEQERMLEERRVGLISQEEVIKELRADKEKSLKQISHLKAERDEATTAHARLAAHTQALEEENKRLGRLLVEAQTEGGRSAAGTSGDHVLRLTNDLKESKIALRQLEADRDRLQEQYERSDRDREKAEGKHAQLEVELQEAIHAKLAAESARNVAQDALAKSEIARHKLAEEAIAAAKAKDQASSGDAADKRELDRARKRVVELEGKLKVATGGDTQLGAAERETFERKVRELGDKAAGAERAMKALQAELDAAKTDVLKARAEAARARAAAEAHAEDLAPPAAPGANGAGNAPQIAARAKEVYEAINDILSEMRNNMVLVQGELPNLKADDGDTLQAVTEAVEALVDHAETAKGALRGLRELAET
jgi:chromosome segregation ATPase